MSLPTISAGDLMGKGVAGMPANPELSVADLQAKFDELSIDVIVPKLQTLVTALESASAGEDLGVTAPTGITASNKVKSVLDAISVILLAIKDKSDGDYDNLVTLLTGITAVSNVVDGLTTTIPTAKAITDFIQGIGGGDMLRITYDANLNGIVDNSERLGGEIPSHYATQQGLIDACAVVTGILEDISQLQEDVASLTSTVLWTNPSPTSSFAGQTVTLSETIDNFLAYEIKYLIINSSTRALTTGRIEKESLTRLNTVSSIIFLREITSVSDAALTFGDGQQILLTTGAQSTNNTYCIPLKVIGYKSI